MERWSDIEFHKTSFSIGGRVNTSRRYSFGGNFEIGDEIYYEADVLGHQIGWGVNGQVRPTDAVALNLNFNARRLTLPDQGNTTAFDVKIVRGQLTWQLTDRLGVRNITEYSTEAETFDFNVLLNYRVNAGTVFYIGYDDHYQQGDYIYGDADGDGSDEQLYFTQDMRRTNRAIFVKMQYLFRM
jgi:hypothetical protein